MKEGEKMMGYEEETELRLGLPWNGSSDQRKRGFSETESECQVDLKLNLASKETDLPNGKSALTNINPSKPPAKAQVVGWPPVRSFRKNMMSVKKNSSSEEKEKAGGSSGSFVKVSVDGAPYLRKVDLKMYKSYQELSDVLGSMFNSFTIGNCGTQGKKDFTNESKLKDLLNGSDYVPTYEDKDGDWMLVGDVPWEMFVESCKRLRIMKGSDATGLAPRTMEKCKNRS